MIAVIDYGMGNLRSIAKALEYAGGEVAVTRDPEVMRKADRFVLPGVGAFGNGMDHLRSFGLIPALEEEILHKKKPFWGICLGMQLLAEKSEEFGEHRGLGWIPAEVKKFSFPGGANLKIPHVGWNTVTFVQEHPVTKGMKNVEYYFVHSYYVVPKEKSLVAGTCTYGVDFAACIARDNLFATQFHPEKSQEAGLKMLRNFCDWRPQITS
ncbi:MAG: imidazole glycerol phosphate synthase subunit HisH [Candidatus Peribacteraceae bacterium]|nr:imidazole glycerol phosphate synthase subunit HisH [Candidatus Peribacteraceae bacterium]